MKEFLKKQLHAILVAERSPSKLAASTAVGCAIAMSPFLGLQTVLIFIMSWFFRLNTTVTFIVAYLVNNPLTMIPILIMDYFVGLWIDTYILHGFLSRLTPGWFASFNKWIDSKIGATLCRYQCPAPFSLWTFIIGGTIFAVVIGIVIYPIAKIFYKKIILRRQARENNSSQ